MSQSDEAAEDRAEDHNASSWHSYPPEAMFGDYLRAAAGLVPAGIVFVTVPVSAVPGTIIGAFAAIFGVFGLRTLLRHGTRLEMTDAGLRMHGALRRTILWAELDRMRLSYYSTRRDRRSGWMQLELTARGSKLSLDSRIEGFDQLVRRAAMAAAARGLDLNESTVANLESLGIRAPVVEDER